MNLWKIAFWIMVIVSGFIHPVISFGLVLLYYLPQIASIVCKECFEAKNQAQNEPILPKSDYYSDDTLEEMK
jgi:hypothetical protein